MSSFTHIMKCWRFITINEQYKENIFLNANAEIDVEAKIGMESSNPLNLGSLGRLSCSLASMLFRVGSTEQVL